MKATSYTCAADDVPADYCIHNNSHSINNWDTLVCKWIRNKKCEVLCLTSNQNKAQFITPGMADGQQSSISQDWYAPGAQQESNGIWDWVGPEQHANKSLKSLCGYAVNPVTYSQIKRIKEFVSGEIKSKAHGEGQNGECTI